MVANRPGFAGTIPESASRVRCPGPRTHMKLS